MKKIKVHYEVAKNLYTGDYEHESTYAEVLVDENVAYDLSLNDCFGRGKPSVNSNYSSLELLLEQLENLRHRTYLHGSIKYIEVVKK